MPIGNLYPEICVFLLTILASKASSEGTTTHLSTSRDVRIECTPDICPPNSTDLFEFSCNLYNVSNGNDQNWIVKCMRSSECLRERSFQKCVLKREQLTICCGDVTASGIEKPILKFTKTSSSSKASSGATLSPTFSSSIISRVGTLIPTSLSSALTSAAGKNSPNSSSSVTARVATLITTSSSLALSLAAEKSSPTSSSSLLSSVQKLSSASSSQIVSPETALSPTTSSSLLSLPPTLSLKPSSSIVSSAAVSSAVVSLAPSSVPSPSSSISSRRSLSPIPSSSVLSSTVLSLLMLSSVAVEPRPPSSPFPTPVFSSPILSTSSSSPSEQFQKLVNDTVSELDRLNVTSNNSLQEAAKLFNNFITKFRDMTLEVRLPGVEKLGTEFIFKVAVAFEKIVVSYGRYHLRGTNRSKRISYPHRNMFLVIQKGYKENASDFHLENPDWQASMSISSRNFAVNESVIVMCAYKDLHDLMQTHAHSVKTRHRELTRITMAAMHPKPEMLQENVTMKFKNLKNDIREKHCVFWSGLRNSRDGFSTDGCHLVTSQSNSEETVCSCDNLTYFAVLVDYTGGSVHVKDEDILEIITDVGLSLSIIGMILTIIMYSLFADVHQPLTQVRLSLAASLGAGQISFLARMHAMGSPIVCITATVLTQYFFMAAFCWMLVEGIYFYFFIVKVYNISKKMIVCHVMAWGFPIILVGISLGVAIRKGGIRSYTSDKYCWLSSTNCLIWIFVLFLTATAVLSSFVLTRVTRELTTLPQTGATQIQRVRLGIRTCVVIISFLVITWSFGLLSPLHETFTYIFIILKSTQGVLIFTLHCVRNSQIMKRLKGKMMTKQIGQIRARLRGRRNVVFSSPNNKISAKKNEKINPCEGDAVWAIN